MYTYLKANIAAIAASMLDYLVTFLLLHFYQSPALLWAAAGTVSGGVLNFAMGRKWVFSATNEGAGGQAIKYFFVWLGSFALNMAGFYVLHNLLGVDAKIAKVSVSVFIGMTYNYLLQKAFVFTHSRVPQQTL